MNIITQNAYKRQRILLYAIKKGVAKAADRFGCSRKTVHKWLKRYDGTLESLKDRSHRPLTVHPNAHTPEEYNLIKNHYTKKMRKTHDFLLLYQHLRDRHGYKRSFGGMKRFINLRFGSPPTAPKPKRKLKPYERAEYIGQKLQLDVKYVPTACLVNGVKLYQFTAVDECSRWTFREIYDEHSTFSARQFLIHLIQNAPFPIRLIQTDNGSEWTNALLVIKRKEKSLFENALINLGIEYKRIQIATPRHNGKVERQHRTATERFYAGRKFYDLSDAQNQIKRYNYTSNNTIKTCLGLKSPNEVVKMYQAVM
jgi:transposase-like protein